MKYKWYFQDSTSERYGGNTYETDSLADILGMDSLNSIFFAAFYFNSYNSFELYNFYINNILTFSKIDQGEKRLKDIKPGIFCLRNELNKRIDVRYTTNYDKAIGTILEEIKYGTISNAQIAQDYKNHLLYFEFLEEVSDKTTQLYRAQYYINHYKDLGYKLYNPREKIKVKVKYSVENYQYYHYFVVRLYKARYRSDVVGVFDNKPEMEEFIKKYYDTKEILPIYANTCYTARYFKSLDQEPWTDPLSRIHNDI